MAKITVASLNEPHRPRLGPEVPLSTFRLLRLVGMPEIFGESTGPALYMTGKTIGRQLALRTIDDFLRFVERQKIGVPEIEQLDGSNLIIRVWECMTCSGLPNIGQFVCHFESGLVAGALENIRQQHAKSTQTKGVSHGDPYCQFEVFFF
ncbi:DUF2507 domain-containing protein [Moorella sp. Hama-1]|uniref:DUF2507 domain-containing protein n=1 Tax=Moorella sp. Hama-1 TaxID=2138101 RepID=UPI000D659227|nr:DUF2507 domain-containing protein [Moorella sp. Hama-1]BCV22232.1 hypothetical protein hamaS1_23010 [Moorella sp. Hama-1]